MNDDTIYDDKDQTIRDEQGKAWSQPPEGPPPGPPPKSNTTLIWVIVGICFGCVIISVGALAAIMFPVFSQAKLAAKKTSTLSNAKQHALGLLMYSTDYDDVLPMRDWCDLSQPYTKSDLYYTSVILSDGKTPRFDFALGATLLGTNMVAVEEPANTFLTFESKNNSKNQIGGIELVPMPGRYTVSTTASCASFTDGHAKFASDEEFRSAGNGSGRYHFFVPPPPIGE